MSEWLAPLERGTSRILEYPAGATFRDTLDNLQKVLTKIFLARYGDRLKKKGISPHSTRPVLEEDLSGWDASIAAYVQADQKLPAPLKDFRVLLTFSKVSFDPDFPAVAQGPLLRAWAEAISKAETKLTGSVFKSPGDPIPMDWWRVNEALAWTRLVRVCIACAMTKALDFEALWRTVDGDAGWWLSEKIGDRVSVLTSLALFREVESLRTSRTSFLGEGLGLASELPEHVGMEAIPRSAKAWQDLRNSASLPVSALGVVRPWHFEPISLDGPTVHGEAVPVQMFARAAATERARRINSLWGERREALIKEGRITRADQFRFVVTAGSLEYGGNHPPHQTHRNGCCFDLDLTFMPDLLKEFGPVPWHPMDTVEIGESGSGEELEPDGSDTLAATPDPSKRPQEWNFPTSNREKEFMAVAMAFTECIYLTFPFSIIYASGLVTKGAKSRLLSRLDLLEEATDLADFRGRRLIAGLRERVEAIIPDPYRKKSEKDETSIRTAHRNHWHVTYDPDSLGDEAGGPTSENPTLAEKSDRLLQEMDALGIAPDLLAVRLEDDVDIPIHP